MWIPPSPGTDARSSNDMSLSIAAIRAFAVSSVIRALLTFPDQTKFSPFLDARIPDHTKRRPIFLRANLPRDPAQRFVDFPAECGHRAPQTATPASRSRS